MGFQIVSKEKEKVFIRRWIATSRAQIAAAQEAGAPASEFAGETDIFSELSLCPFWGFRSFVYNQGTIITASFGKSADKEWGKGINVMVVHTQPAFRGTGGAKGAYLALGDYARKRGYSRVTTVSGSYGGWRTHHALGFTAWGLNNQGQIVFESPLDTRTPKSPPPRARKLGSRRPLTLEDQVRVLTDPAGPYRVRPSQLPAGLSSMVV